MNNLLFTKRIACGNLLSNLSTDELKILASSDAIGNRWGITVYRSLIRSRSAAETYLISEPTVDLKNEINSVRQYLNSVDLIGVDKDICKDEKFHFNVKFYVTRRFARIAHMFNANFFPSTNADDPDIVIVMVPEWKNRAIYVYPSDNGIVYNFVLGTDYYGEAKMAALRSALYLTREYRNGLGLHAGGKLFRAIENDRVVENGALIFGLSGTGKTTITINDHGFVPPEGISILQDDIMLLRDDGFAYGTENNFYIKTDNVTNQPEIFQAVQAPTAIAENVWVDDEGEIDFDNLSLTSNGRCLVSRFALPHSRDSVDLSDVSCMFFNTRRNDLPPIGKLSSAYQAAAYFMLGESMSTSASDPESVGKSKRVVGFNPFVLNHPEKEGNKLLEILKKNKIEVYIVNTGSIGEKDITSDITMGLIKDVIRENIKWKFDDVLGYFTVEKSASCDPREFDPYKIFGEDYSLMMERLYNERMSYLSEFDGLNKEISGHLRERR